MLLGHEKGVGSAEVQDEMRKRGIEYVYVGQVNGRHPDLDMIDPQALKADPDFELLYHQDRVWVFKLR